MIILTTLPNLSNNTKLNDNIDTGLAQTVFERAKIGESPEKEKTEKEKTENKMVDILGEVEDGEKIITKIVSKTNDEGLEKLSTIEDISEKSEETESSPIKIIS